MAACRDDAVDVLQAKPDHQAPPGDHLGEERALVLGAVERRVHLEQFQAGSVARFGGGGRERGAPLGDGVGPEAVPGDVQHRARVPGQDTCLQAVGGGGDAHRPPARLGQVQDVG